MHPRNPLGGGKYPPPDYHSIYRWHYQCCSLETLEKACPVFQPRFDFGNESRVRALNIALYSHYFGITLTLNNDSGVASLCPPLGSRLDYILMIEDLVSEYIKDCDDPITVLDIGTGSTAVYPLLGLAWRPDWQWIGTELDSDAVSGALKALDANAHLLSERDAGRGRVFALASPEDFFPPPSQSFDICMCNPPFYDSSSTSDEALSSRGTKRHCYSASLTAKKRPAFGAAFGMSMSEAFCPGGDFGYFVRLFAASRDRFLEQKSASGSKPTSIFTCLFGLKSSAERAFALLQGSSFFVRGSSMQFIQQGMTRRWILAWSFCIAIRNGPPMCSPRDLKIVRLALPVSSSPFSIALKESLWGRRGKHRPVDLKVTLRPGPQILSLQLISGAWHEFEAFCSFLHRRLAQNCTLDAVLFESPSLNDQ